MGKMKQLLDDKSDNDFDLGWNAAVVTIAQSIESMKVFGDTAASFAVFIKEFQRDMAFPTTPTADTEEQQPTEVQPEQP